MQEEIAITYFFPPNVTSDVIVVLRQCLIAHSHPQTCKSQMQDVHKIQLTKLAT